MSMTDCQLTNKKAAMEEGVPVVNYISTRNPNLVYEIEFEDTGSQAPSFEDDSVEEVVAFRDDTVEEKEDEGDEDEASLLNSNRRPRTERRSIFDMMDESTETSAATTKKRPVEEIGYNFKENFHTVREGREREGEDEDGGEGGDEGGDGDFLFEPASGKGSSTRGGGMVKRQKYENGEPQRENPAIVDPENSLLTFLSILAVQLNRPFDELVTPGGLPSPEVQGMLEMARAYIVRYSSLNNVELKHLVYDTGDNPEVRMRVIELLSALIHKQSGGSAYGQRINPQNGGGLTYFTSANYRLRNGNFRKLLGFQQLFKRLYWRKNPRIIELDKEIRAYEALIRSGNGKNGTLQDLIDEKTQAREILEIAMPQVLALGATGW